MKLSIVRLVFQMIAIRLLLQKSSPLMKSPSNFFFFPFFFHFSPWTICIHLFLSWCSALGKSTPFLMSLTSCIYPLQCRAKQIQIQMFQINLQFKFKWKYSNLHRSFMSVLVLDLSELDFKYIRLHIDKTKSGFLGQNIYLTLMPFQTSV